MVLLALSGCSQRSGSNLNEETTGKEVPVSGNPVVKDGLMSEESMRQAALDGDATLVSEMIQAGAQVNAINQDGQTALMLAAFNGHIEIVRLLLESEAVIDRRDLVGRTALLYASTGPFAETVKLLLDSGAEPNIVDSDEHFSPLMYAASEGNLDVVKVLVAAGADITLLDVDSDDAETFARQAGHTDVAEYLHSVKR